MPSCSRCGRTTEVEYGSDGQAYCSACAFYGMNKQCSRCRMYLPAAELQQYRGQLACPYCVQDMRSEETKKAPAAERPRMEALILSEQCERCGRDLESRVYVWNGRKLCHSCLGDEQKKWGLAGGGPMGPPQRIRIEAARPAQKKSMVEAAISEFLAITGIRKKPETKEAIVYYPTLHAEIAGAKPLSEKEINAPIRKTMEEAKKPQQEGIIRVPSEKKEEAKAERGAAKRKKKGKKGREENPGGSGEEDKQ